MGDAVHARIPAQHHELFISIIRHNVVFPADAFRWAEILFAEKLDYTPEGVDILRVAGPELFTAAIEFLNETGTDFKALANRLQAKSGLKGKSLFQPLRVALTGELAGPEMAPITQLLGLDHMRKRLHHAANI
jgi:glutamyl-tRNA synthetase